MPEIPRRTPPGVDNALVDIAVNLVESYLRLTGYLTVSEMEIQGRNDDGTFSTLTDVDVVGLRSPGPLYLGDPHQGDRLLLIEDEALELAEDCVDILIGEVKQGTADFNPGLKDHRVLHSLLRRFNWLFAEPVTNAVDGLQQSGVHYSPARGGGRIRTRLVAFGQAEANTVNTIRIGHVVETMLGFFARYDDAFRPIQFKEPSVALLRLLQKAGFEVRR